MLSCECACRCAESNEHVEKHSDEKVNEGKKEGDIFQALFKQTSVANETSGGQNNNAKSTVLEHNRPVVNGMEQLCNSVMGTGMLLYLPRGKKTLRVYKRSLIYWGIFGELS